MQYINSLIQISTKDVLGFFFNVMSSEKYLETFTDNFFWATATLNNKPQKIQVSSFFQNKHPLPASVGKVTF